MGVRRSLRDVWACSIMRKLLGVLLVLAASVLALKPWLVYDVLTIGRCLGIRSAVGGTDRLDAGGHALEEGEVAYLIRVKLDPVRDVLAYPGGGHRCRRLGLGVGLPQVD